MIHRNEIWNFNSFECRLSVIDGYANAKINARNENDISVRVSPAALRKLPNRKWNKRFELNWRSFVARRRIRNSTEKKTSSENRFDCNLFLHLQFRSNSNAIDRLADFRSKWEKIFKVSSFHSPNEVNQIAINWFADVIAAVINVNFLVASFVVLRLIKCNFSSSFSI